MSAFRKWEQEDFGKFNWIRNGVKAAVGLPTVITAASLGAAKGAVIGAAFAGIGFLTGPILGGILGGAIFFLVSLLLFF